MPRLLLPAFLLTLSLAGADAAIASGSRLWPLPIEVNLSSSFGEYRSGHLHAGIDIRTFGREGVPCRAVDDGFVSRLRAAPNGYGKAVYVKLATGETAVYAHLSEFAPHLEEALHEQQLQAGRYKVDVYYDDDSRFPVRRGDIIGYTGSTGATAPHLHFEVRDERENPLNPLSLGWELEDRHRPSFESAVWIPLGKETSINGRCEARDVGLRLKAPGHYVASDTVAVEGRVGLGVYIIDRANPSSGRLAPYRVEMTIDGVLLSSITLESFTYGHTGEVVLAYEMGRVRANKKYHLLLFKRTGETLWNRDFINDGVIDSGLLPTLLGEKRRAHTVVVRATDRAGNVSTASFPIVIGTRATRANAAAADDGIPGCYFFDNLLSIEVGAADFVFINGDKEQRIGAGMSGQTTFSAADLFQNILRASPAGDEHPSGVHALKSKNGVFPRRYVLPMRAGAATETIFDDLGVGIVTSERSLFGDALMHVGRWRNRMPAGIVDGNLYAVVSEPVEIGPLSLALRKPVEVRFVRSGRDVDTRAAVYSLDERRGGWDYAESEVKGDTVVTWVKNPGVYAVLVDRETPRITRPRLSRRRIYATGGSATEIVVKIDDEGCGVDDARTEVWLDGKKRIARWDGFSNTMFVPVTGDHRGTHHHVKVVAYDRVGNESRSESRVAARSTQ